MISEEKEEKLEVSETHEDSIDNKMISEEKEEKPVKKNRNLPFAMDFFLAANPQIHKEIDNGNYVSLEEYMKSVDIIGAVKNGSLRFHPDYDSFDEQKYLASFPDVKAEVGKGRLKTGFEHFMQNGYVEILEKRRIWQKASDDSNNLSTDDKYLTGFIDHSIIISNHSIYINGWFFVKNSKIKEVYLSNNVDILQLTGEMIHYARPDLAEIAGEKHLTAGFYCYVENKLIDIEKSSSYALLIVTENSLNKHITFNAQENPNRNHVSQIILSQLLINRDMQKNMDKHIGIALRTYMQRYQLKISRDDISVDAYGSQIENPKVSIVVPLYGRIDFVEFQLSQFANDKFFKENAELIYVLDDPKLEKELIPLCYGIYPIFEIPFRVVSTHQNCGYAMANNIGASYANAPLVLFFNSDLFPMDTIWLERLLEIYKSGGNIGVLCPKLVFEDGAIQHAGMIFERNEELNMWLNEHPGKGLPDMNLEIETRAMPAVTGACMLIRKTLYEEVGGMSENYFLGDFEDSDLCLKLHEKGYINYYAPSVKLCHLERQSQSLFSNVSWKSKVTLYNAWQHERRWGQTITAVMKDYYAN